MVAADAKLNFDDNAAFRQKEIFALRDPSQEDPREVCVCVFNIYIFEMIVHLFLREDSCLCNCEIITREGWMLYLMHVKIDTSLRAKTQASRHIKLD